MDRLLSSFEDQCHWLQEEATRTSFGEADGRCASCWMEDCHLLRNPRSNLPCCYLCHCLYVSRLTPLFQGALLTRRRFVKSFPDPKTNVQNPSGLIRILIIAIGPIVFNAAILLALFLVSLFLGAMLESCCAKFGSVMDCNCTRHRLGWNDSVL